MKDLNDLYAFAKVVQHGGFSAAARVLRVTKSSLSKRVARLEHCYGARLIERSPRGIRVTHVGRALHAQCEALVAAAEDAPTAVAEALGSLRGTIRVACPPGLLRDILMPLIPEFLTTYPDVRLALVVSNRRVDVVEDGFDVAFRAHQGPYAGSEAVMRRLGVSKMILVGSPAHLASRAPVLTVPDLSRGPLLTTSDTVMTERWTLLNEGGQEAHVEFMPRLASCNLLFVLEATLDSIGIALLPEINVREALRRGHLVHVLPPWRAPDSIVHLVFASRRGLAPATRAFVEHVAKEFPRLLGPSSTDV